MCCTAPVAHGVEPPATPEVGAYGIAHDDAAAGQHQQADDLCSVQCGPLQGVDVSHAAVAHEEDGHAGNGDSQVQPLKEDGLRVEELTAFQELDWVPSTRPSQTAGARNRQQPVMVSSTTGETHMAE